MWKKRVFLRLMIGTAVLLTGATSFAQDRRVPLLHVSQGQRPNDTAFDDKSKISIEEYVQLGGKALRVDYASGDSFGNKGVGERDWKSFVAVEFTAFNPLQQSVHLTFSVRHRRTTNYQTRVDLPVVLKAGKNHVRLGIDEMINVNGSTPDLSAVQHWYLSCESGQTPTVYFGDFWLVGGSAPATAAGGGPGGVAKPGGTYRVRGTIGGQDVDLTVTPIEEAPPGSLGASGSRLQTVPKTDPARLARLRAAQMPQLQQPVMFHTPEADAILAALEIFPPDNAFNQVVEDWPLHPNSKNIVVSIGLEKPFRYNPDMGFILVPPDQPLVNVKIVAYPQESDPGPFPVPDNLPIEGWPAGYVHSLGKVPSLAEVQRRPAKPAEDRHAIIVDPVQRKLYEFFVMGQTKDGWAADQASIFDLKTNQLRPDSWTSADAAGLPIFPAVVRYDELQRGLVEHAMRVTVRRSRRAYVHPATHYASQLEDENLPRMGERLRLRANFEVNGFSPPVQAILKGLKKYGMFVADNGNEWAISVTPDPRIPDLHEELRKIKGADFEVVLPPK